MKMTEEQTKTKQSELKTGVPGQGGLQERKKENDNIIFVGGKPLVNYIRAVVTQFTKWNADEVIIKSRGKFISKAVDVAEVARRSITEKNLGIKDVRIASESFESEGKKTNISTMDIVLRAH